MSEPHALPPFPPPSPSSMAMIMPPPNSLFKHKSWSPDAYRDEAWHRRRSNSLNKIQRGKSVTDEDLDELKACIELGFGFQLPEMEESDEDRRLSDTLPALGLYYAVNRSYKSSTASSECDSTTSPIGSPNTIYGPGKNPQTVKARLKQWAQVVACTVRQTSS